MDSDLIHALWRDCKLNMALAERILNSGLLKAKVPELRNFKELYKVYIRHQPAIWAEGNAQAEDTISLLGEEPGYGRPKAPRQKANVLHLVASFKGADQIKQLSDIGAMLALWAIEETCFWVKEDKDENENDPENAKFECLWGKPVDVEQTHAQYNYDESFIEKLNSLLQG